MGAKTELAVYWFRKCLRLHDNPALIKCIQAAGMSISLWVMDVIEHVNIGIKLYYISIPTNIQSRVPQTYLLVSL